MKNVRMFFKKSGPLRFVSHLDMTRVMTRLLRLSKVPIWYTEGFNRHPYITFALPLSLGFSSEYEVMDFRFDDENDNFDIKLAEKMIKNVAPNGIEVIALKEPVFKSGKITMADFEITFFKGSGVELKSLEDFLNSKEIIVSKTTKKGGTKQIDLAPKIISSKVADGEEITLSLRLPAGGEDNINPKILVDKYLNEIGKQGGFYTVNRTGLFLADGTKFE